MGTSVFFGDESTLAEGVEKQPSAETEALLDPEDVTLMEVDQDSYLTESSQRDRRTRPPNWQSLSLAPPSLRESYKPKSSSEVPQQPFFAEGSGNSI
ncbi:hypothetical protein JTB14_034360 [Gonioctena quinquepunctata]|nr:hypothetical protein JTB14_034360 [Gonioctena quinquepunctata]